MKLRSTHTNNRRGTAVVEFALVAPLIMMLLLGLWEVGCMVEAEQVINNAAREGARQGSTGKKTLTEVQDAVKNYILASNILNPGVSTSVITVTVTNVTQNTVNADPRNFNNLDHFRVDVQVPFDNVRWCFVNRFNTTTFATIPTPTSLNADSHWYSMKDSPVSVAYTPPIE